MALERCALCLQDRDLLESHIVPKFVGRYLKGSSGTGGFRTNHTPNRSVQDLEKRRLLCAECELRFSKDEAAFAERAFKPYLESAADITYDTWLMRFGVSLLWRTAVTEVNDPGLSAATAGQVKAHAERWRAFLLGQPGHGPIEGVHAVLMPLQLRLAKDAAGTRRFSYPLRAVDRTIFAFDLIVNGCRSPGPVIVYAKLPGFLFLGLVADCAPFLDGTLVGERGILSDAKQRITDARFEPCLTQIISHRLGLIEEAEKRLSARQLDKVSAALQQQMTSGREPTQDALARLMDARVDALLRRPPPS
jgi:hypothetical protein